MCKLKNRVALTSLSFSVFCFLLSLSLTLSPVAQNVLASQIGTAPMRAGRRRNLDPSFGPTSSLKKEIEKNTFFLMRLPRKAPEGIDDDTWLQYLITVKMKGERQAKRPHPTHSVWKTIFKTEKTEIPKEKTLNTLISKYSKCQSK